MREGREEGREEGGGEDAASVVTFLSDGRGRGEGGQVWSHAWRDVGSVVEYSIEYQFIIN